MWVRLMMRKILHSSNRRDLERTIGVRVWSPKAAQQVFTNRPQAVKSQFGSVTGASRDLGWCGASCSGGHVAGRVAHRHSCLYCLYAVLNVTGAEKRLEYTLSSESLYQSPPLFSLQLPIPSFCVFWRLQCVVNNLTQFTLTFICTWDTLHYLYLYSLCITHYTSRLFGSRPDPEMKIWRVNWVTSLSLYTPGSRSTSMIRCYTLCGHLLVLMWEMSRNPEINLN